MTIIFIALAVIFVIAAIYFFINSSVLVGAGMGALALACGVGAYLDPFGGSKSEDPFDSMSWSGTNIDESQKKQYFVSDDQSVGASDIRSQFRLDFERELSRQNQEVSIGQGKDFETASFNLSGYGATEMAANDSSSQIEDSQSLIHDQAETSSVNDKKSGPLIPNNLPAKQGPLHLGSNETGDNMSLHSYILDSSAANDSLEGYLQNKSSGDYLLTDDMYSNH